MMRPCTCVGRGLPDVRAAVGHPGRGLRGRDAQASPSGARAASGEEAPGRRDLFPGAARAHPSRGPGCASCLDRQLARPRPPAGGANWAEAESAPARKPSHFPARLHTSAVRGNAPAGTAACVPAKSITGVDRWWGGVAITSELGGLDADAVGGTTTAPGDTTTAMTASLAMPVSSRGQPGTASLSPHFSCVKEGNNSLRERDSEHTE